MSKKYVDRIVKHYEDCLKKHGDSHLGVDWPNRKDAQTRYKIMLDIIRLAEDDSEKVSLLDFGCGAAHLLEHIELHELNNIDYSGLDLSAKFISLSKEKFPSTTFYQLDILDQESTLPIFDYIIMNGVFTEKRELSFEEMWDYFCRMLSRVFNFAKKGVAFNAMSKAVDWERDDLFHLPADTLIDFITKKITRKFIIRNDYGLYEFTCYIYK